jgi:uncharacterized protein DUF5615
VKPSFLLDEQISPRAAVRLKSAGIDARAVCGSEPAGRDDDAVFRAAVREGRIMVTYDIADFAGIHADLLKEGVAVPGLVFVSRARYRSHEFDRLARALIALARRIAARKADASAGLFLI